MSVNNLALNLYCDVCQCPTPHRSIPEREVSGEDAADDRARLALLRKGRVRDSSRESSVVSGLHEQTHPAELQDQ